MLGLPEVLIVFKTLASSLINRSSRGVVALILKDDTSEFDTKIYTKASDVASADWTAGNVDYIAKAFLGKPSRVIVERVDTDEALTDAFARLKNKAFNYLAVPEATSLEVTAISNWIKACRADDKKSFKAVLPNIAADSEGVINFTTEDIKVGETTYTATEYCARIAGILAGTPIDQSSTYYVLSEVESITESLTPDTDIGAGKMILINDGTKIKIGRGVNSFTTTTATKGEDFKKIKIIDAMDMIGDDIRTTFEDNYIGKVPNSYDNKILFCAAVNKYLKTIQGDGVLYDQFENTVSIDIDAQAQWLEDNDVDISEMSEEQIKTAPTGSNVFLAGQIKIQDAMEDLAFNISM